MSAPRDVRSPEPLGPVRSVSVGDAVFGGESIAIIAGPCVLESADLVLRTAETLQTLCAERTIPFVFKSSYKKANRSSIRSHTGPGLEEGLALLRRVTETLGVPILTDVHEVHEVPSVAEVADCIQIPAFLSRQTDLLVAAGRSGRVVNVKKGQFLSPDEMRHAVGKVESTDPSGVMVTERGHTFGYHDLVVDFRSFVALRELGWPVLYDASHSLQKPGGEVTGGDRRYALPLLRAAVAAGVDGLFFETHPDPERALSDAATQLPLEWVGPLLDQTLRVREAIADAHPSRSAAR